MRKLRMNLRDAENALRVAAEEAYNEEIIDTLMEDITIGEDNEYVSKEDWIDERIEKWYKVVEKAK